MRCVKATEKYFSGDAVYYAVQGGSSRLWMKFLSGIHSNETQEQYFPVVLFIMLCNKALTFESMDKIPLNQHSGI